MNNWTSSEALELLDKFSFRTAKVNASYAILSAPFLILIVGMSVLGISFGTVESLIMLVLTGMLCFGGVVGIVTLQRQNRKWFALITGEYTADEHDDEADEDAGNTRMEIWVKRGNTLSRTLRKYSTEEVASLLRCHAENGYLNRITLQGHNVWTNITENYPYIVRDLIDAGVINDTIEKLFTEHGLESLKAWELEDGS